MESRLCWFVAWFLFALSPGDASDNWLTSEDLLVAVATTPKSTNLSEEGSGSQEVTIPLAVDAILFDTSNTSLNTNETVTFSVGDESVIPTTKPSQLETSKISTTRGVGNNSKRKKANKNRQRPPAAKNDANVTESGAGQLNDNPWYYGSNDALYGRGPRRRNQSKETKAKNPVVSPPVTIWDTNPPWKVSKEQWGVFWPVHYYSTGSLFIVLSIYSVASLVRIRTFPSLIGWGRFLTLHVFLLLLGVTRAVYLLYDPYTSGNRLHPFLVCALLHVGDPCLVSSFAIVISALLNETLVPFAFSGPIRRPSGLAILIVFHVAIATAIVAGIVLRSVLLALVGHFLMSLWFALLTATFIVAFPRLRRTALRKQGDMIRVAFTKLHIDGAQLPRKLPRPTLALSVKVALLSAFLCLTLALLRLYSIVNFFCSFRLPEPWTWWGCQLARRVTELLLATSLAFVASQPMDDRFFDDDSRGEQHTESTLPLPDTLPLRSLLQHATGSTVTSDGRPSSMLFKENGFIRFRNETDPEQPMDCSEDDDDNEGDSVRANAGSQCDAADVVMSPFFRHGKRFSRGSLDTSASSEQLSRMGLSNSAIDFQLRKYGSTCSSESAANSFDVTFFLQQQRSISPLAAARAISATPRRRIPGVFLNLDLRNDDRVVGCGVVNVACGTEDITPDSAVYLDLHLAKREIPLHSHSLGDLATSSRSRRTLLKRFKGSCFSLNASLNGYEPLDAEEDEDRCGNLRRGWRRARRWRHPSLSDVRDFVKGVELPQVDSGLLGDCMEPVLQVDRASQTDDVQAGIMSVCDEIGRWNSADVEQEVV